MANGLLGGASQGKIGKKKIGTKKLIQGRFVSFLKQRSDCSLPKIERIVQNILTDFTISCYEIFFCLNCLRTFSFIDNCISGTINQQIALKVNQGG